MDGKFKFKLMGETSDSLINMFHLKTESLLKLSETVTLLPEDTTMDPK